MFLAFSTFLEFLEILYKWKFFARKSEIRDQVCFAIAIQSLIKGCAKLVKLPLTYIWKAYTSKMVETKVEGNDSGKAQDALGHWKTVRKGL